MIKCPGEKKYLIGRKISKQPIKQKQAVFKNE